MKNKIFKAVVIALLCVGTCGCGLFKKTPKNNGGDTVMTAMYGQTMIINSRQLDSVCFVDGLARELDKWLVVTYNDYETGEAITRYAYVKVIGESDELTYILTPKDTLYQLTKRFVKEEEEDE